MQLKKEPKIVTRFIGYKQHFDKTQNVVRAAAFITDNNKLQQEISVYDIDEELKNNNLKKIFEYGDKLYRNPPTPARADLEVSKIKQIKNDKEFLSVSPTFWNKKHYNIKKFPSEDLKAFKIATELARISTLHLRPKF